MFSVLGLLFAGDHTILVRLDGFELEEAIDVASDWFARFGVVEVGTTEEMERAAASVQGVTP